jgi:nitric oxide reductase subunit C
MRERTLALAVAVGTLAFVGVLAALTADSLSEVRRAGTPPLTAAVVAGKRVFQSRNCNDCHTILGIGAYLAPELTKVAERRDATWLRAWLADPQAAKPGTTMPNQRLATADVADLIVFFQWVARINTQHWPPLPRTALGAAGGGPSGTLLFQQKGCSGCHQMDGQGPVGPGPDLTHIGSTPYDGLPNTPEFLASWLDDPPARKPGTLMPRIPMSTEERDALVRFLAEHR